MRFLQFQILSILLFLSINVIGQKGSVIIDSIDSEYLVNDFGEKTTREVAVYLPPGYEDNDKRYPVIYFLHGFMGDHTMMNFMSELLDFAIETRRIRPFIMVIPNEKTSYDGSFYSNSGVFGNWEDFTTFDLVEYMDTHYRTIADKDSRGITGHSMGGYGAIKIAMHHPEIFSSVYMINPGALTIVREYGPKSNTYKALSEIDNMEDLMKSYFPKVIVAFARSWSPNPNKPPFYCDIPFTYDDEGNLEVHSEVLDKWYANMPMHMLDGNLENLQKLTAIKMDWGRHSGERFTLQCMMFSQRLENLGIEHFAEEYIGDHGTEVYQKNGRITQSVLPFFDYYLDFGDQ